MQVNIHLKLLKENLSVWKSEVVKEGCGFDPLIT